MFHFTFYISRVHITVLFRFITYQEIGFVLILIFIRQQLAYYCYYLSRRAWKGREFCRAQILKLQLQNTNFVTLMKIECAEYLPFCGAHKLEGLVGWRNEIFALETLCNTSTCWLSKINFISIPIFIFNKMLRLHEQSENEFRK